MSRCGLCGDAVEPLEEHWVVWQCAMSSCERWQTFDWPTTMLLDFGNVDGTHWHGQYQCSSCRQLLLRIVKPGALGIPSGELPFFAQPFKRGD